MVKGNVQLTALALLVKKFGERIPGGFEVRVGASELIEMSPYGTFQEVPDMNGRGVRWQYFPNTTIDTEGHVVPDEPSKGFVDYAGDSDLDTACKSQSLPYSDEEKVEDADPQT